MKKIILVLALSLFLTSCNFRKKEVEIEEDVKIETSIEKKDTIKENKEENKIETELKKEKLTGDQEFLIEVAKAFNTTQATTEELYKTYSDGDISELLKLVDEIRQIAEIELEYISSYAEKSFKDLKLGDKRDEYIEALNTLASIQGEFDLIRNAELYQDAYNSRLDCIRFFKNYDDFIDNVDSEYLNSLDNLQNIEFI